MATSTNSPSSPCNELGPTAGRSRNGCWTCREKKVKCDERRPKCIRCLRLGRHCDYVPRPRKPYVRGAPRRRCSQTDKQPLDRHAQQPLQLGESDSPQPRPSPASAASTAPAESAPLLSPADRDAIYYFRTAVSQSVDTKDVEFSVPAIIAALAETEPMVLHMVCALGHHERCTQQPTDDATAAAVEHYSTVMLLIAQALQDPPRSDWPHLDSTLVTLWLMIVYEQRYGDGLGLGLRAHLRGAALVLQHRLGSLRHLLEHDVADPDALWPISPLAGRMIVWIAFLDASAESNQLGGDFNRVLGAAMTGLAENEILSRLRGYTAIQRYATSLHRVTWGARYPQQQLLEDLESREVLALYGECGQMRHVLAQLAETPADPLPVARALHDISQRYGHLLAAARFLELGGAGDHRQFVRNMRFVVPFYHAAVLWYFRITAPTTPFRHSEKQQHALDEILALAYQAYRDEGEPAMARIAWPLFMTAIETDDLAHQDWVCLRFANLCGRGENYRRAEKALQFVLAKQRQSGGRVDVAGNFQSGALERFLI
ncbi:fungal-specific transcription factor domain-containing protein [Aspergillus spinulosporus]